MITITCKCGKTKITFKHLSQSDFPNGFLADCCPEEIVVVVTEEPKEVILEAPKPKKKRNLGKKKGLINEQKS